MSRGGSRFYRLGERASDGNSYGQAGLVENAFCRGRVLQHARELARTRKYPENFAILAEVRRLPDSRMVEERRFSSRFHPYGPTRRAHAGSSRDRAFRR